MQDASDIMYDRLPVSNFYKTFKNDGKERYLKSKVNPAKSNKVEDDGHFVSDDAPITQARLERVSQSSDFAPRRIDGAALSPSAMRRVIDCSSSFPCR